MNQPPISREQLAEKLAIVSHETWMLQKERDQGADPATLSKEVHDHDRERAELTVRRLEELGVVSWSEWDRL